MSFKLCTLAAALALSLSCLTPVHGAEPAPLAAYLTYAKYRNLLLSPNGRYLALLTPIQGKYNLAVVDLQTKKSQALTSLPDFDVMSFRWIGNERLAFSVGRLNTPTGPDAGDGGGLFIVSRDGKESRTFTPTLRERAAKAGGGYGTARGLSFYRALPGNDEEFLAAGNLRQVDSFDLYRVNAVTGKQTLLTFEHPGKVQEWVLDPQQIPRAVVVTDKKDEAFEGNARVLYRDSANDGWQEVASVPLRTGDVFKVVGFAPNGQLLVASNQGRDTTAVFYFDPKSKKLGDLVAAHPRYDIEMDAGGGDTPGVITHPETHELLGVQVDAEELQTSWFHEDYASIQAQMEATFPGKQVSISRRKGARTLVQVSSSTSVPRSYLFDEQNKQLEELLSSHELLKDEHLVPWRPFLLKTRDGLELPAYYALPKDYKPGQRLPVVLHIHGGPHVRADSGGFIAGFGALEAQILASRGYAVVVPNHRVTPGFGRKIYMAGFGAVGRQMSEDHEDAAAWAVQQGFADPKRICITGASYGGYATLQALVKTPDLFACGIAGLSVSDFQTQLTSTAGDTATNKGGVAYWRRLLGMAKDDPWSKVYPISPARNLDRIKAPLAMYAGRDDIRTPLEQTTMVIEGMKKLGKPVEYAFIAEGEAHGFGKLENNLKSYELMLDFLDRHIGPKSRFAKPQ